MCLSLKQRQKVSKVQPGLQGLEPAREYGSPWRWSLLGATSVAGSSDWDQGSGLWIWIWICHCSWPRMEAPSSLSSWSEEREEHSSLHL